MASSQPSYLRRLRSGVFQWLADNDFGVHDLTEPFPADVEWPIYRGPDFASTIPDQFVGVTVLSPVIQRTDYVVPIQFRFRGLPDANSDAVEDQGDALARAFRPNGFPLSHVTFGDVRIGKVVYQNSTLLGKDPSRRYEFVATYQFFGRRVAGQ